MQSLHLLRSTDTGKIGLSHLISLKNRKNDVHDPLAPGQNGGTMNSGRVFRVLAVVDMISCAFFHVLHKLLCSSKDDVFPDLNLPNRLFDGVPFKEIPIVNIKTTKNNTIITVSDFKGEDNISLFYPYFTAFNFD